jgi:hypothetical protein
VWVKPDAINAITTVPTADPVASVAHATANAAANTTGDAGANATADTAGPNSAEQWTPMLEADSTKDESIPGSNLLCEPLLQRSAPELD